jgi:hypothetical protein
VAEPLNYAGRKNLSNAIIVVITSPVYLVKTAVQVEESCITRTDVVNIMVMRDGTDSGHHIAQIC